MSTTASYKVFLNTLNFCAYFGIIKLHTSDKSSLVLLFRDRSNKVIFKKVFELNEWISSDSNILVFNNCYNRSAKTSLMNLGIMIRNYDYYCQL